MTRALCCHDEWPLSKRETTQSSATRQWHQRRHQFCTSIEFWRNLVWCVRLWVREEEMSTISKGLCISSGRLLISGSKKDKQRRGPGQQLVERGQVVTGSCLGLLWLVEYSLWSPHPKLHHSNILFHLTIVLNVIQDRNLSNQSVFEPVMGSGDDTCGKSSLTTFSSNSRVV